MRFGKGAGVSTSKTRDIVQRGSQGARGNLQQLGTKGVAWWAYRQTRVCDLDFSVLSPRNAQGVPILCGTPRPRPRASDRDRTAGGLPMVLFRSVSISRASRARGGGARSRYRMCRAVCERHSQRNDINDRECQQPNRRATIVVGGGPPISTYPPIDADMVGDVCVVGAASAG